MPDRQPPLFAEPEREMLVGFLDYLRESVILKVQGLDDAAARRPGVPSGTSLHGLVQHLAAAEDEWFRSKFEGSSEGNPHAVNEAASVGEAIAAYRRVAFRSNEIVIAASGLEQRVARLPGLDLTLRWVLVHMIEETARHAGHADIPREQLDGSVGR